MNPVFSKILPDLLIIGGHYLESGHIHFNDWAEVMKRDLLEFGASRTDIEDNIQLLHNLCSKAYDEILRNPPIDKKGAEIFVKDFASKYTGLRYDEYNFGSSEKPDEQEIGSGIISHDAFIKLYNSGLISVGIDKSLSLRLIDHPFVPNRFKVAHYFWSWIWVFLLPISIVLMIWVKVWLGILMLILIPIMGKAIKESSSQFVFEVALENEEFYLDAIDTGALNIKTTTVAEN